MCPGTPGSLLCILEHCNTCDAVFNSSPNRMHKQEQLQELCLHICQNGFFCASVVLCHLQVVVLEVFCARARVLFAVPGSAGVPWVAFQEVLSASWMQEDTQVYADSISG